MTHAFRKGCSAMNQTSTCTLEVALRLKSNAKRQKKVATIVRKVALTFHKVTCHEGINYQKVIKKCLKQSFL